MCPNQVECFEKGTATFLIMGKICTRNCAFCAIGHGRPEEIDPNEPINVALAILELQITYAVVTSVTRDDLLDGGAKHYAKTTLEIKRLNPGTKIELLIPDFRGSCAALDAVINSRPDVMSHNLETVPSLYRYIRPQADYNGSIQLIRNVKLIDPNIVTKSGIMLGLGEEVEEVLNLFDDLKEAGCDILTIGQYLQPSPGHYPVMEYIHPSIFQFYENEARKRGFMGVASSPFVRSSYRAAELFREASDMNRGNN
jgi:lipoic acid synthetase